MPLLTIVTINRNDAFGLAATAASIHALAFKDHEWLVIDGGSTDGSLEVVRRTRPSTFVSEQDLGRYDAMNKGIRLAAGEYILFMNSGDRFHHPECLDFLTSSDGQALIHGNAEFEANGMHFTFRSHIEGPFSFVRQHPFCHQSVIYHLAALRELGGYNLAYRVSADFDLTYRYVRKYGCRRSSEYIATFATGGFGRQNQFRSLRERLHSLHSAGPASVFLLALIAAPYVMAKFLAIALVEPLGILCIYRETRSRVHRWIERRAIAARAIPSIAMLGIRIQATRTPDRGAISFVNPYSLVQVASSNITDVELGQITFYSDGIALCLLAKICYGVKVSRISFDFTSIASEILGDANVHGRRLSIVGGTDASSTGFARYLAQHYPNIELDLVRSGYFQGGDEMQDLAVTLSRRAPQIVLLGMGGGLQEQFAVQIVRAGFNGLVYTCGGFFDQTVSSGGNYYPRWIDRLHLRWAYRIIREPRRLFFRYAVDYPKFLFLLARHGSSRP
ncbi:MAG: WecB/TagA/CpsF family glycosyltransferase [Sulfuritalea sp.]|nr:WecB/TagA/CpsF family glycosyltransferase [Sulfuritalea sp.]